MDDRGIALTALVLVCGAATYVWRGAGVWIADRIDVDGRPFRWASCVAFAIIAGLVSRVIFLPTGDLATTPLWARLVAVAIALVAFRIGRRSLLLGVLAGSAALPLLILLSPVAGAG
jgi:branched-subunit amino acid transport protein